MCWLCTQKKMLRFGHRVQNQTFSCDLDQQPRAAVSMPAFWHWHLSVLSQNNLIQLRCGSRALAWWQWKRTIRISIDSGTVVSEHLPTVFHPVISNFILQFGVKGTVTGWESSIDLIACNTCRQSMDRNGVERFISILRNTIEGNPLFRCRWDTKLKCLKFN